MTCKCGCTETARHTFRLNFAGGVRIEMWQGRQHVVAPLVMLRETVVNGAFVPAGELKPEGWNGVPVTIGHPQSSGYPISANSPQAWEEWRVGTVFNARYEGGKLKAEAWLDIDIAEARHPGIIARIQSGMPMDVSTGYFATDDELSGVHNGKEYVMVHRDIKPDHLALLPDEEGACNWADGCGVRVNANGGQMESNQPPTGDEVAGFRRFLAALGIAPRNNRRGEDDEYRQMIADLVSDDRSPFVPDDEYALREMTYDTVKAMRDVYLTTNASKGDPEMGDQNKPGETPEMTADQIREIATNAVKEAIGPAVAEAVDMAMNAKRRSELVDAIHANTEAPKDELVKLSTNALESMASKIKPAADYSGRGINTNGGETVTRFPGMANPHAAKTEA